MSGGLPQVRVFHDLEALSRGAADLFTSSAKSAAASQGRFAVALSGGSTPRRFYSLLGSVPYRNTIDWTKVHVFWADERCVPADHIESNFKLAADAFLSRVDLPKEHIHRIRGEENPERAAQEYEKDLRSFFGPEPYPAFDLIVLGIGEDGHTASLFPNAPALREKKRLAVPVYPASRKLNRITLTLPALNYALQVLFLASGRAKATVVHEIMEDKNPRQCPAGLVQPVRGVVTWMIDRDAAGLLTGQLT